MKRIFRIIMVLAILLSYYAPLIEVKALDVQETNCTLKYRIIEKDSAGIETNIGCTTSYTEAKTIMNNYNSTSSKVAVMYEENKVVNSKYAIIKFFPSLIVNIYTTATSNIKHTSVATSYGTDAAFLDYEPTTKMFKVRISGYTGWVYASNAMLVPITDLSSNYVRVLKTTSTNIRSSYNTTASILGTTIKGDYYRYYEKKTGEGYTWYHIKYNNQDAWFASSSGWTEEINMKGLQTYYEPYGPTGNIIHYFEHRISGTASQSFTNLGPKPTFLQADVTYYSFDGNYFYRDILSMLDDYRNNSTTKALNKNNPYYAYYLYLPNHSKTGYTADDFNLDIRNRGYISNAEPFIRYVKCEEDAVGNCLKDSTGNIKWIPEWEPTPVSTNGAPVTVNRSSISLLYGMGEALVNVGNTYGVNTLMMYSTAINESATGTSIIAFAKNNLFGIGAVDSNPFYGARTYNTVEDSFIGFARLSGTGYSDPTSNLYNGSHYGNKGSGMNVNYATDPYWGEKQAQYSYRTDKDFGLQDYKANTVGVKIITADVPILKTPSSTSPVIYNLKNSYYNRSVVNIPVIVYDKVYTIEEGILKGWYKVYTDSALDDNQNLYAGDYNFSKSYGYIAEDKLYVENNQPIITASDISIEQGTTYDYLNNVTATDIEDGVLTEKLEYTTNLDVNKVGQYHVYYTVVDNNGFSATKDVTVDVIQTGYPMIHASNLTISEGTAYNPLSKVSANDHVDGDITSKIVIVSNNVNVNVAGDYTVTYKVTNTLGLETNKTVTVTVVSNAHPVISATNRTIKINSTFNPLEGVTASDLEDGNLTSNIIVTSNLVDITKVGNYNVIYEVTDNNGNKTTKTITITVESIDYINKSGDFYFENMKWNDTTNKLDLSGYLAIKGINNRATDTFTYDLILKSNISSVEITLPLERWLIGQPTRHYNDGTYDYSATWFKGSLNLDNIPHGEYTLYVRARSGQYQSINLFRNVFLKDMTRKAQSDNGHGFLFRNNSYKSDFPIELFVYDNGLINLTEPSHQSNMITSYKTIGFSGNNLNIVGTSYNIGGNYSATTNVEREIIFEEVSSHIRYNYSVGSYVGTEIPLKADDGFSKVKAWFNTEGKVDISTLPKGKYIIYLHTKSPNVDDFGELNDIFLKSLDGVTATINGKIYTITINKTLRFRLELNIA